MSTVKVAAIQHPSAATAAITLDAAGGALIGGQAAYARNLLYNGAMQVAQRGTSAASITGGGYFTADRWYQNTSSLGTWTQTVENDAPTGSGLRKSLRVLCTTADAAPAAGDFLLLQQPLEGQDVQRIAKGTASALQLTLSFWVKSNVTGTYVTELVDNDNTRFVSASYSVSASATWEKKTITFPADMTGVLDNDNAASLTLNYWLGAGSTYSGGSPLRTAWGTTTNTRAVGQTNLAAATNNYWQVTGVQLEVGPAATPFEFKSFGQELRECQRYCQRFDGGTDVRIGFARTVSGILAVGIIPFLQRMRVTPTVISWNAIQLENPGIASYAATAITLNNAAPTSAGIAISVASGLPSPETVIVQFGVSGFLLVAAEL